MPDPTSTHPFSSADQASKVGPGKIIPLTDCPVFVINLDESRARWIQCHRRLTTIFSAERIKRVPAFDGRNFAASSHPFGWDPQLLKQFRREGFLGQQPVPDPVRTALCMSHQRALREFIQSAERGEVSEESWAIVMEDDIRPAETLLDASSPEIRVQLPHDTDVAFLHDRVVSALTSGPPVQKVHTSPEIFPVEWRRVTGGIGLEAYMVSHEGACKLLAAWRPLYFECDLQLMTFMSGYRDGIAHHPKGDARADQPSDESLAIQGYAPSRPLFQIDEDLPSIKFQLLDQIKTAAPTHQPLWLNPSFDSKASLAFSACWFNPAHYRARLENMLRFLDGVEGSNVLILELAFGDDDWQLPDDTPNLMRLRSDTICWQKEALLNVGMSTLHKMGFPYLGWLDADVIFKSQNWQERLLEALQSKKLCQVFETVETVFPDRGMQSAPGAASAWMTHGIHPVQTRVTGFGWAMPRDVWSDVRLFDLNLLGGGDHTMWRAAFHNYIDHDELFGKSPYPKSFDSVRRDWAGRWSAKVGMSIGFAKDVRLASLPHGREKDRQYFSRGRLLSDNGFDLLRHIQHDANGLLQWTDEAPQALRDAVKGYFTSRNEDFLG